MPGRHEGLPPPAAPLRAGLRSPLRALPPQDVAPDGSAVPGPREGEGGTGARCGGPTVGLRGAPRRPREGAAPAPPNATPPRRRGAAAVTAGGGRAGRGRGARPKFLPPWEQRELCLGICHRRGPQTFRGTSAPRRRPRRCGRAPPAPRLRPRRGGGGGATPALPMQGPRRRRRRPGGKSAAGAAQNMESRAGCVRGGTVRCSARLGGRCGAVRGGAVRARSAASFPLCGRAGSRPPLGRREKFVRVPGRSARWVLFALGAVCPFGLRSGQLFGTGAGSVGFYFFFLRVGGGGGGRVRVSVGSPRGFGFPSLFPSSSSGAGPRRPLCALRSPVPVAGGSAPDPSRRVLR